MCGRFTYLFTWKQLHKLLSLDSTSGEELPRRYNVAPTQLAPVVRSGGGWARAGAMLRWGLIPPWADDPKIGNMLINARSETVATKPAFRKAFAERRCIIPVSGFYEWRKTPGSKTKQPYYIRASGEEPLLLAGLWEKWQPPGDAPAVESFTIITTTTNELMAELHDRMPAILDPIGAKAWLDPGAAPEMLAALLKPYPSELMMRVPVSSKVNSPKNEGPELLQEVQEEERGLF